MDQKSVQYTKIIIIGATPINSNNMLFQLEVFFFHVVLYFLVHYYNIEYQNGTLSKISLKESSNDNG